MLLLCSVNNQYTLPSITNPIQKNPIHLFILLIQILKVHPQPNLIAIYKKMNIHI